MYRKWINFSEYLSFIYFTNNGKHPAPSHFIVFARIYSIFPAHNMADDGKIEKKIPLSVMVICKTNKQLIFKFIMCAAAPCRTVAFTHTFHLCVRKMLHKCTYKFAYWNNIFLWYLGSKCCYGCCCCFCILYQINSTTHTKTNTTSVCMLMWGASTRK